MVWIVTTREPAEGRDNLLDFYAYRGDARVIVAV